MELQLEKENQYTTPGAREFRARSEIKKRSGSKFVGVRQRPSGKWVAEIKDTTRKIRMWLGTYQTPEEAARAYDEAACLIRGSHTRTNFVTRPVVSQDSPLAFRIRNLLSSKHKGSDTHGCAVSLGRKATASSASSITGFNASSMKNGCWASCTITGGFSTKHVGSGEAIHNTLLSNDAYKPELCLEEKLLDLGSDHGCEFPWAFMYGIDHLSFTQQEPAQGAANSEFYQVTLEGHAKDSSISVVNEVQGFMASGVHGCNETLLDYSSLWS